MAKQICNFSQLFAVTDNATTPVKRKAKMEYLIRFIQMHETFRKPETDSLADLNGFKLEWLSYSDDSPFAIVRFPDNIDHEIAAKAIISRSIMTYAIYELWGSGKDYETLHKDIRDRSEHLWEQYRQPSFRFELDSFHGSRTHSEQREIMESLGYMEFKGPIVMRNPDHRFGIFEDFKLDAEAPHQLHFGRLVAESGRKAITKYNLKKRKYIATTSMDAELSLVTANMAQVGPGRLSYDPFMGTGSFPLACAHFGSTVFGSDMDGRSVRGKKGRNVKANFEQYGTSSLYLDGFVSDLTNTPLRRSRYLDSVVCDPPYGVREGLKVLGSFKPALQQEVLLWNGMPAHLQDGYIPPKRPYSFLRMLDDILDFSSTMLVDGGRLCMWMPVAGAVDEKEAAETETVPEEAPEQQEQYDIPQHPALELVSCCTQDFNKWSRQLLTYRRLRDEEIDVESLAAYQMQRLGIQANGSTAKGTADELNGFRRKYFQGFKERT